MRLLIALIALTLTVQPCLAQPYEHHWGGPHWGSWGHGGPVGYYHHGGGGAEGFWGGVVGGTLGALLFPRQETVVVAQPPPVVVVPERSVEWCMGRYRSYNPATRTYFGFDGQFHACP